MSCDRSVYPAGACDAPARLGADHRGDQHVALSNPRFVQQRPKLLRWPRIRTARRVPRHLRHWHGQAPAFDRGLDPGSIGLGRSTEEIRAWELHFHRVLGPPPRRVLDVGTGAGSLSLLLASLGYEVTACDAVQRMLDFTAAKAERTGLRVELHRALADDLPFESGAFDAVTSKLVVDAA